MYKQFSKYHKSCFFLTNLIEQTIFFKNYKRPIFEIARMYELHYISKILGTLKKNPLDIFFLAKTK